jgi:hypothetical protein
LLNLVRDTVPLVLLLYNLLKCFGSLLKKGRFNSFLSLVRDAMSLVLLLCNLLFLCRNLLTSNVFVRSTLPLVLLL